MTLNEAVTAPLVDAGFQCGNVTFKSATVNPFRYVMPGPADDDTHVAYFSPLRAPSGTARIAQPNATFGWADGHRHGGHVLPLETIIAGPGETTARGFRTNPPSRQTKNHVHVNRHGGTGEVVRRSGKLRVTHGPLRCGV